MKSRLSLSQVRRFSESATSSHTPLEKPWADELIRISEAKLLKTESVLVSPQGPHPTILTAPRAKDQPEPRKMTNFCSNNYLDLANHRDVIAGAHGALDRYGFGLSSVRFICGTQSIHHELERKLALFHGTQSAMLYNSCFDANTGLFEALLTEKDAVVSDDLIHASLIDGIRLCKASRYRYRHIDMHSLAHALGRARAEDCEKVLIVTDGVFSMDGDVTPLGAICDLAEAFDALVMVDDCHGTGVLGAGGRGTPEFTETMQRVDILNSTLGKAVGGGAGGYTAASLTITNLLRQKSRPYLFSNAVPPCVVGGALAALDILAGPQICAPHNGLLSRLRHNTEMFRSEMSRVGYKIAKGIHPIVPVMLGDARMAVEMARRLVEDHGIFVVPFSFPVVPRDTARIRVQLSAGHTIEDVEGAVRAFEEVGKQMGVLGG